MFMWQLLPAGAAAGQELTGQKSGPVSSRSMLLRLQLRRLAHREASLPQIVSFDRCALFSESRCTEFGVQ